MSCPSFEICLSASSCNYPDAFLNDIALGWRTFLGCLCTGLLVCLYGWQFVRRKWTPCYCAKKHVVHGRAAAAVSPDDSDSNPRRVSHIHDVIQSQGAAMGSRTEMDMLPVHEEVAADGALKETDHVQITPFLRPGPASERLESQKPRYWATEENFTRSAAEVLYPPTSSNLREYTPQRMSEGAICGLLHMVLTNYWNFKLIASTLFTSLGWAFICSAMATYYWLLQAHCGGCELQLGAANINAGLNSDVWVICNRRDYAEKWGKVLASMYDDYKFFPIFLLVGYTGYLVAKFKDWMVNCHTVQARIHDIGVLVGGAIVQPDDQHARSRVYTVYRLLNLIHLLTYQDHTLELCDLSYEDLVQLGLLSQTEYKFIAPYREGETKSKARDMAIAWLSGELSGMLKDEVLHNAYGQEVSANVAGLRGICARHHDLFLRDNPNVYLSTMILTSNYLLIMIVAGAPFVTCIYVPGQDVPFQVATLLGVFMLLSAFLLANALAYILRDPFLTKHSAGSTYDQTGMKLDDMIDCRALIHSTDCCIFAQLRANFGKAKAEAREQAGACSEV